VKIRQLKLIRRTVALGLSVLAASSGSVAFAQSSQTQELAKSLSNPVAALISVPLQLNYDSGFGPSDGSATVLNVQPVVPISLNENWNLISRTILPIRSQTDIFGPSGTQSGLGDTIQSLFLSPKAPTAGGLIWGAGPVFLVPTSTEPELGVGEWGGGPTAVALIQKGPWTFGGLANHIWTFDSDTVNATFLQPFVTYTTPTAWTYGANLESTYDWNAEEWTVPLNLSVGKIVSYGDQLASVTAGVGYYLDSPENGPDGWRGRLVLTYLFPK
jgi:hypothetical protein